MISGSLPAGAPPDALAELVGHSHAHGRPVLVDTSGRGAGIDALSARPTLVKPNADELAELTGDSDPRYAAARLARLHADRGRRVARARRRSSPSTDAARGRHGRRGHSPATRPAPVTPLVAALARGLSRNDDLPDMLADASPSRRRPC